MPYFIKARKFTADAADAVKLGDPSDNFRSRRNRRSGISKKKERDKSKADAHRRRESEEQLYSTIIDWLADQRET